MNTRVDSGRGAAWPGRRWAHRVCRAALVWLLGAAGGSWAAEIIDLQFNALPGGRFEAQLVFDAPPPEPEIYTIQRPARIALDLPGVTSGLAERRYALDYENATSAVVLEGQGRTRMVLNLLEPAAHETRIEGNVLHVEVGGAGAADYLKPAAEPSLASLETSAAPAGDSAVAGLDFRRGDDGEGQLVIDLNDPRADISVAVEGERIKVRLRNATLPESLQRNYNVEDFATPVQSFRAESDRRNATITLRTRGDYDYLAYQASNRYVVSVKPLSRAEAEERQGEFAYTGERLSLNFQDIEVRAVLQLIADFTGLNLVASDTVQGRITLRLQNVPWDQALDLVLKTKGLGQRQIGNVLLVAPASEIAERERRELESRRQVAELSPLQTEHVQVRYASASRLAQMFRSGEGGDAAGSMLSERGRIIVDERTNTLLITETASRMEELRRILRALDIPVRQVLIEARIVIANSNLDEALGIRWGASGVERHGSRTLSFGDSLLGALEDAEQGLRSGALNVDLGPTRSPFGQFAIGYAGENALLGLELAALEAQGRGEVVSQPKVITGDNQQATIKSGQEVPYQEAAASGETTVSFKDAVLKLDVRPTITPDDRIMLDLVINQDSIGEEVPTGQFGGFIPTIDTTELQTQVLVKNGETVVLGGVFRTEKLESEDKVPFLGDIPYVGRLFKRSMTSHNKVETLIFITPRILTDTLID